MEWKIIFLFKFMTCYIINIIVHNLVFNDLYGFVSLQSVNFVFVFTFSIILVISTCNFVEKLYTSYQIFWTFFSYFSFYIFCFPLKVCTFYVIDF